MTMSPSAMINSNSCLRVGGRLLIRSNRPSRPGDVGAVLNVLRRPESLGGCVVPPVEQRVERFSHDFLVVVRGGLSHPSVSDTVVLWENRPTRPG